MQATEATILRLYNDGADLVPLRRAKQRSKMPGRLVEAPQTIRSANALILQL